MAKSTELTLAERIEAHRQRGRELEAEREQIVAESTEAKLERNRAATRAWIVEHGELEREASKATSAASKSAELEQVIAEIADNLSRERHLHADAVEKLHGQPLPAKFIRLDALEFFQKQAAEHTAKAAELRRRHTSRTSTPGPRIVAEINQQEAHASDLEKSKPLQLLGQQIARLREDRALLEEKRQHLEEQHRKAALAAS